MKIILTGATGFVGSSVLAHLIADERVSQITSITRRSADPAAPKLTTILQEDFHSYEPALLDQLAHNDACIWALGGKASDLGEPEVFARITHDFTLALAKGIAERTSKPFTFCYLSGMGADPTEKARLPWEKLTRHLKGRTERDLQVLQAENGAFSAHAFRPGGILPDGASRLVRLALAPIVFSVGELVVAMIDVAKSGRLFRRQPIIGNSDIKRLAKASAHPN